MRDVPMDDGLGLSDADGGGANVDGRSGDAGDMDVSDVAVEGLDVGFDFLDSVDPMGDANGAPGTAGSGADADRMTESDVTEFRSRWADIQASFIDDPHRACEQADNLVDLVLQRLTERFARERNDLVRAWDRGNEPTETEDLRVAMKGYRGLVDRLLTAEL